MSNVIPMPSTERDYVAEIRAALNQSLKGFVEAGQALIDARNKYPHGEWMLMLERVPMGQSYANKLMQIAKHRVISNSDHDPNLPPAFNNLYEIALMPASEVKALLADGTINAKTKRSELKAIRSARKPKPAPPPRPVPARPAPPPPKAPSPFLTREQVDPEFTGDAIAFTDKYGLIPILTAEQYQTVRFTDLTYHVRMLAKTARELPERRALDLHWLRSPKPHDIAKLSDALAVLRPLLAEAEAALAHALATQPQPESESPPSD